MLNTERDEIFTPHGTVRLRPLTPGDTELVHGWLTDPHCAFWGMQQASVNDVAVEYDRLRASPKKPGSSSCARTLPPRADRWASSRTTTRAAWFWTRCWPGLLARRLLVSGS